MLIWDCWRCVWHEQKHKPAWWWVSFFRDLYYHTLARMNPGDICCVFYFPSFYFLFFCFCFFFVSVMCSNTSTHLSLCQPLPCFRSFWWTWLLPSSHSITCRLIDGVLVFTYWALDYRHPLPPSSSLSYTDKKGRKKTQFLYGWSECKGFFSLTAGIFVSKEG